MKSLSKMVKVFGLIFMVSACATTNQPISEKYALDKQLEQVKEIQNFRMGQGRMPTFLIIGSSGVVDSKEIPNKSNSEGHGEDLRDSINQLNTVTLSESSHQWIKVDNQSLIIRTGPSEYHLLVLQIPAAYLMFSENISFISPTNVIRAGLDLVQLDDNINYVIDRIYKINNHEQMYAIKNQLVGKNKE
jgi:hypothetical protein